MPIILNKSEQIEAEQTIFNPEWRIDHLYSIRNKDKERVRFKRNYVQMIISNLIKEVKERENKKGKKARVVVLKSRQLGTTTGLCVENIDLINFSRDQFVAIMAHRREEVFILFYDLVSFLFNEMDEDCRERTKYDSKTFLSLENGSKICVVMDAHGLTPNVLHITEAARLNDSRNRITEAMQGVPDSGLVIMESTANGTSGFFYDTVQDCLKGDKTWDFKFLSWLDEPSYTISSQHLDLSDEEEDLRNKFPTFDNGRVAWRRDKIKEFGGDRIDIISGLNGVQLFNQNYPFTPQQAFVVASGGIFDSDIIESLMQKSTMPKSIKNIGPGRLSLWYTIEQLTDVYSFLVTADPAEGKGGDYSAAIILGLRKNKTPVFVGTLHGHYPPAMFAGELLKLSKDYKNALIIVERNNHGHAVLNELYNRSSNANIYHHRDWDAKTQREDLTPGYPISESTRAIVLSDLQEILTNDFKIPDSETLGELSTFRYIRGKAQADSGCHDDLVMSLAIGVSVYISGRWDDRSIGRVPKQKAF